MTFDQVCAVLCREPFNLSFAQIAALTDYQIGEILFKHPADEPTPSAAGGDEPQNLEYSELFRRVWARRGLTEEQIAEKWKDEMGEEW